MFIESLQYISLMVDYSGNSTDESKWIDLRVNRRLNKLDFVIDKMWRVKEMGESYMTPGFSGMGNRRDVVEFPEDRDDMTRDNFLRFVLVGEIMSLFLELFSQKCLGDIQAEMSSRQ